MDPIWIAIAFALGFAARQVGLPPLVGFLAAGFVLHLVGIEGGALLEQIAELGVTLLLFTIGLKLRIRTLLRPEIWAVASTHMAITMLVFGTGIFALAGMGIGIAVGLDFKLSLLVAFALSFSSTVFAVKVLEDKGEMGSLHGRISIGILIMQDIIAVVFLAASTGKIPTPMAIGLFLLIPLRPALMYLMDRSGHGELLILYGLLLAFGGAALFTSVGMKADLGALFFGVLLASHPKASELSKSLMGIKDLFLVGFFLSIGLYGAPDLDAILMSLILVAVMGLKVILFFFLLTRFKLRARTSLLTSLSLANYSEFGLIVGAIAAGNQWISGEWLVIIAVALAMTFVIASPLNNAAHSLYARYENYLHRFETSQRLPDDQPISSGDIEIGIIGMGRMGTAAYDRLHEQYGTLVGGLERDAAKVEKHRTSGRNVVLGDATDWDFWQKVEPGKLRVVLLTLPNSNENIFAVQQLRAMGFTGTVTATARFADEIEDLKAAGIDAVFDFYSEAGVGFADHVSEQLLKA